HIGDNPDDLTERIACDKSLKKLCTDVSWAATSLSMNESRHRTAFASPVDPEFRETWRCYEEHYAGVLAGIWLSDIGLEIRDSEDSTSLSRLDIHWENADAHAQEQASAIEVALEFAEDQASQEWRDFGKGFPESIEEGIIAWRKLKDVTGFEMRGIFRRRELVPFVLVPRHVANKHGNAEKLSLYTHLQQAHEAFVFGAPLASLALMRSIMEMILRDHYHDHAKGKNLEKLIDNCPSLPEGASVAALHRLRTLVNAILHFDNNAIRIPKSLYSKEMEQEIVSLLLVLRNLIEGVPSQRG
ncbi:MAG: hypothetical protein AB7O70_09040, partial [Hyphomicrobiales bacterium]